MTTLRGAAVGLLALLPTVLYHVTLFQLAKYRRDGAGFLASFMSIGIRQARPDLYTDQGQHLLKWLWAFGVAALPWALLIVLLLG